MEKKMAAGYGEWLVSTHIKRMRGKSDLSRTQDLVCCALSIIDDLRSSASVEEKPLLDCCYYSLASTHLLLHHASSINRGETTQPSGGSPAPDSRPLNPLEG